MQMKIIKSDNYVQRCTKKVRNVLNNTLAVDQHSRHSPPV